MFTKGDTLANGATVIDYTEREHEYQPGFTETHRVVLAHNGHMYVTWRCDEKGNTFWGHYHHKLDEARKDFHER
jgi:hypothetical protein